MNQLTNSSEPGQITRIREILNELVHDKKLGKTRLANYLKLQKHQRSAFFKFIKGAPFPTYLELIAGKILEKLEKLLENPNLIYSESGIEENTSGYGIPPLSYLVWIPFDLKLPVVDYIGPEPPLKCVTMGKKKGIVALRNTSKNDADGEIYIDHIGMATDIEPGTRIVIKRIDKTDWQTDRYYLIINTKEDKNIWELLPGDNEKTVRSVSIRAPEGPHKIHLLEDIVAIFSIIEGNYIPRPKRNSTITPASRPS